jgi:phosphoglycerate dehydrogenase-like enzyme
VSCVCETSPVVQPLSIQSARGTDEAPAPVHVFVGPLPLPDVQRAVAAAGCVVAPELADADAVVWSGKDPHQLIAGLHPGVRWVQLPDAGIERWLAAGVLSPSRVVTSARGVYGQQVAEHALALLLACTRRLHTAARVSMWSPDAVRGDVLAGGTVVVVGSGDIGSALLAMLAPLRCRTVAVTLRGREVPGADVNLPADRVDEALPEADVVVLAAPSTPQTVGFLDARRLALLKPTAYVVNVGRGDLVVTDDLVAALDQERLGGAALDVTDPEPLPEGHPLWRSPRVLITPHTANPPAAKQASFVRRVAENCARFAAGEPLVGVVDAGLGY